MQQHIRSNVLNDFKAGKRPVLIATDVAAGFARKFDIVINWDMPSRLEQYVHRVGRTGRQGREGLAYTFHAKLCIHGQRFGTIAKAMAAN